MALLLDIFGFLSVVLRGIILSAQSLAIGGILFLTLLVWPLAPQLGTGGAAVMAKTRRLLFWSALTLALAEVIFIVLECVVLAGTVAIPLGDAFGANFARLGLVAIAAALGTAFIAVGPLTGAMLLLTHSRALSNIKEQLLIEISDVALALCGMTAGIARWLELRLDEPGSRVASWIWPTAFVLVGVILLFYKEA